MRRAPAITMVGPYPPPYGGVSTHVMRLRHHLRALGFSVPVWRQPSPDAPADGDADIRPLTSRRRPACYAGWILDARQPFPGEIAHFHELRAYALWAVAALRRRKPVVVTIHNQFMLEEPSFFCRLSRWAVRQAGASPQGRFIAVSPRIGAQLESLAVRPERIAVIPAYLPPPACQPVDALPEPIRAFAAGRRPLFTVYGIRCERSARWGDLYGIDQAVEALARLTLRYAGAGLIVLTPGNARAPHVCHLKHRAQQLGIADRILWWTESLPDASALWALSDVYLRPTATDGDALAVREALDRGVPAVASDVCARPEGTVVYRSGDMAALTHAIDGALSGPRPPAGATGDRGLKAVLRVYGDLIPHLMSVAWERP